MSVEFCRNGHIRTEANTSFVRDSTRNRVRKRCLACRNDSYSSVGKPTVTEMSRMATDYLHEDIEDLLNFGSTYNEILERGGFSSWNTLYRSLKRRERFDLIERLRDKKAMV